jgi:hypothetical protein
MAIVAAGNHDQIGAALDWCLGVSLQRQSSSRGQGGSAGNSDIGKNAHDEPPPSCILMIATQATLTSRCDALVQEQRIRVPRNDKTIA